MIIEVIDCRGECAYNYGQGISSRQNAKVEGRLRTCLACGYQVEISPAGQHILSTEEIQGIRDVINQTHKALMRLLEAHEEWLDTDWHALVNDAASSLKASMSSPILPTPPPFRCSF